MTSIIVTLDRIEGGAAVFIGEDEAVYELSRALLPEGTREGDIFNAENNNGILNLISKDEKATKLRKERMKALFDKMINN